MIDRRRFLEVAAATGLSAGLVRTAEAKTAVRLRANLTRHADRDGCSAHAGRF